MVLSAFVRFISAFILVPLAALLLALSLFSYSASIILTDQDNAKSWLKDEQVREELKKDILEGVENKKELSLIRYLFGDDKVEEFVNENLKVEWTDQYIDQLVDETYQWLESDGDSKEIEKSGLLGLNLSDTLNFLPHIYQLLIGAYKKLFFITAVLIGIIFLTSKNFRRGFFLIGLIGVISGGFLYFGPDYIGSNQDILKRIDLFGFNFKGYYELPGVYQKIIQLALEDVSANMNRYAFMIFITGLITAVVTQFAVKRVELDDGVYDTQVSDRDFDPRGNYQDDTEDVAKDLMAEEFGSSASRGVRGRMSGEMGSKVKSPEEKVYIRDKDGNFVEVEEE